MICVPPQALARFYGVPLVDYERPGHGLLVGSGAGIMMAAMDVAVAFRWCFDIDGMREYRFIRDFLVMIERCCPQVTHFGVVGWFSITDPGPLIDALGQLSRPCWTYGGDRRLTSNVCDTLADFVDATKGLS